MKQANLGLNKNQLKDRQSWLQDQAQDLLATYHLPEILSTVGQPQLVGSVAYQLMVWPDVDYEVLTDDRPNPEQALRIVKSLLETGITKVNIVDHRQSTSSNIPHGIYIGPDVVHQDLKWQIDIWLIEKNEAEQRRRPISQLMSRLTDQHREIILALKQYAAASDRYHRGVSSVDLYTAVVQHNVTTIDQFNTYLQNRGKQL